MMSAVFCIKEYRTFQETSQIISGNPMLQAFGIYNHWIGGESFSLGFFLFFSLLPLLSTLSYGWSYCLERNCGYSKMAMVQMGRKKYFLVKYISTFCAGGISVTVPLIFNFLLCACIIPAVRPTIIYEVYYPMHYGSMGSEYFFTHPLLFTIGYLLLDFIFAGLFAAASLTVAFFVKTQIAVVLVPYFVILGLHYFRTSLYGKFYKEISPLNYLHAADIENVVDYKIVIAEMLIFFLIPGVIYLVKGIRYEDL